MIFDGALFLALISAAGPTATIRDASRRTNAQSMSRHAVRSLVLAEGAFQRRSRSLCPRATPSVACLSIASLLWHRGCVRHRQSRRYTGGGALRELTRQCSCAHPNHQARLGCRAHRVSHGFGRKSGVTADDAGAGRFPTNIFYRARRDVGAGGIQRGRGLCVLRSPPVTAYTLSAHRMVNPYPPRRRVFSCPLDIEPDVTGCSAQGLVRYNLQLATDCRFLRKWTRETRY
jgi:hypothetical protein